MANFNLGDLESLEPGRSSRDVITIKSLKDCNVERHKIRKPPYYADYSDWNEEEYRFSDQFSWPLTKKCDWEEEKYIPMQNKRRTKSYQDRSRLYTVPEEEKYKDKKNIINDFDYSNFPLKILDIEKEVMDDFTVTLIGRRRSGKSWAARWLLYHLKHRFPAGVVITGTKLNNFWSQHIPDEFVHDVDDLEIVLTKVFKRQKYILEHPELELDPRFILVLDDVLKEKYIVRFSKLLSQCFTDGRHHKIFLLITCQDPRAIPPTLRENTDLAIIFRQFQRGRKEAVATDFLDFLPDKNDSLDFLWNKTGLINKGTGKPLEEEFATPEDIKNAIPIAVCVLQSKVTENLQWVFKKFVAEDPGDFVIGNELYWKAMESGRYLSLAHSFKKMMDGTH